MSSTAIEKMVTGPRLSEMLGIPVDQLYAASDRGQFARYYLFGTRKYYLPSEALASLKTLVPGDPSKFRQMVAALNAAAPVQARRPRRSARGPRRGSTEATA